MRTFLTPRFTHVYWTKRYMKKTMKTIEIPFHKPQNQQKWAMASNTKLKRNEVSNIIHRYEIQALIY